MNTNVKAEKARMMMYKRSALSEINLESIESNLCDISEDCDDVKWFMSSDGSLLDALDGDEEAEYEFKLLFSDLCNECEQLSDMLYGSDSYVTEHFNDFFVGIMLNNHSPYALIGFDSYEEDYFELSRYETKWAENESAKRIKRLTKDQILSVCGQCFGIAVSYLNIRYKYDYLSATMDILKGENGAILQAVKDIEKYYTDAEKENFYEYADKTREFDKLLSQLPDRLWLE